MHKVELILDVNINVPNVNCIKAWEALLVEHDIEAIMV